MTKAHRICCGLVFFLFQWVLLTQAGWHKGTLPLVLIWGGFVSIVGYALLRGNPLASLLGSPLNAGWSFLWASLPILANGLWGVQTGTFHLKNMAMTAAVVWLPFVFWYLGNFVRDRVLMDVLMLVSLLLPWKLKFLNEAWGFSPGRGGFHGVYGLIAIHVGLTLLPSRISLPSFIDGVQKKDWLKGASLGLLCLIGLFLAAKNGLPHHGLDFRASLPLEILSLIAVFALIEELMFRGFAMNYISSLTGSPVLGVFLAAAVGAVLSTLGSPVAALSLGLAAGTVYLFTSSLLVTTVIAGVLRAVVVLFFI